MVKSAAFLNLGSVPLNELSVVMDVRPVREQKVYCALVQHKPKEGSLWWTICGGTGAHSHQGLIFWCRSSLARAAEATDFVLWSWLPTAACWLFKSKSRSAVAIPAWLLGQRPHFVRRDARGSGRVH
jgi:hypothetical protein